MHVIATAGHVDHGKSALLRALTGMEPDRWAEEKRRGMTIDLGYAWMTLASGERLAFVDVPGHSRFVPNSRGGGGPAPAVLFVVAADGGWMPQSAEHLAAIDALGISRGVLAVTRADLADPSRAIALATAQIRRSSLGDVRAVAVSAITGAGLPELIGALGELAGQLPPADPRRLPVAAGGRGRVPGAPRNKAVPARGRAIGPGLSGAVVLAAAPPPLPRRGAATAAAAELAAWPNRPAAADLVRRRGLAAATDLTAMGVTDQPEPVAAGWLADSDHWAGLAARRGASVARHAEREPLPPGLPAEAAREALRLPDRRLVLALASAAPSVTATAGVLTVRTRPDSLPPALAASVASLLADLADRPFDAPDATRLSELGLEKRDLAAAARHGALLRLTDPIVLAPGAGERAAQILTGLDQPFTAAAARVALGSTRRTVIPLLEHLDRLRLTHRLPDDRRKIRGQDRARF